MAVTTVVHWRDGYDVLIDRTTKWGNLFIVGVDGNRAQVIEKYRVWVPKQPDLMGALDSLRGLRLGCHCKPRACHGDVLVELLRCTSCEQERPTSTIMYARSPDDPTLVPHRWCDECADMHCGGLRSLCCSVPDRCHRCGGPSVRGAHLVCERCGVLWES